MDPSEFILNKNDIERMAEKENEKGGNIQKSKHFKYSQSQKLPNCEPIMKKLDADDLGWIEMEPEHLDMLTRFHPLNETSQVVEIEKRSSSSATDKVANSVSACSLEGGICTKFTKQGMGRGRGRRKTIIPEDDTFITRQLEKYLGIDYIQPNMSFIGDNIKMNPNHNKEELVEQDVEQEQEFHLEDRSYY